MAKKRKTFAWRLTTKAVLWGVFITIGLSFMLFYFEGKATGEFYSEIYRNKMLITNEYTRRVLSDVYVAVTNNIYYLEHTLDNPEEHKMTMERLVKNGTRIRSCGISFIEDYYPQKGHHFCPYAWRNTADPDIVYSQDMGDADLDYLNDDWFLDVVKSDSARWSDPFYDGSFKKTPLSAYLAPIHDQDGRVVAVLGADLSFDWLTSKLSEVDSTVNKKTMFMASKFKVKSSSFLINCDGTYLTHSDESNILHGNFFSQLGSCDGSDVQGFIGKMQAGVDPDGKSNERFLVNGEECFVFYTPVKYTNWLMVSVVPCQAIDILGYLNAGTILFVFLLAILLLVVVIHFYIKNGIAPLKQLAQVTNDIAQGRFDTPTPDIKHNDEISQLRDSIEEMQYTLSNYADSAKHS